MTLHMAGNSKDDSREMQSFFDGGFLIKSRVSLMVTTMEKRVSGVEHVRVNERVKQTRAIQWTKLDNTTAVDRTQSGLQVRAFLVAAVRSVAWIETDFNLAFTLDGLLPKE